MKFSLLDGFGLGLLVFTIVLGIVVTGGCGPPPPPAEHVGKPEGSELPTNAKVEEDLGNGWTLFSLEIQGEKRYFLFHFKTGYKRANESITEIRPPR